MKGYIPYMAVSALIAVPLVYIINPDINSLFDLWYWLTRLFMPKDGFIMYHFTNLNKQFKSKLPFQSFINTLNSLRYVSGAMDGDITVFDLEHVINGEQIYINISQHIAPHIHTIRTIVTGLYVILLVYYNYRQIMFLIRGTTFNHGRKGNC